MQNSPEVWRGWASSQISVTFSLHVFWQTTALAFVVRAVQIAVISAHFIDHKYSVVPRHVFQKAALCFHLASRTWLKCCVLLRARNVAAEGSVEVVPGLLISSKCRSIVLKISCRERKHGNLISVQLYPLLNQCCRGESLYLLFLIISFSEVHVPFQQVSFRHFCMRCCRFQSE